jgi:hypothetical protein
MAPLSYRRHRFPPEIIQHAIWLYLRFALSYRDVEELLAERGLDISYETLRRWVSADWSSCSNNARRLARQPRIGRSLSSPSKARIAALSSPSEKKHRFRSRARSSVRRQRCRIGLDYHASAGLNTSLTRRKSKLCWPRNFFEGV